MTGAAQSESLSREHTELLVELAVALHKSAIYPLGHPILRAGVESLAKRLGDALHTYSAISIGVARHQLVVEGIATNSEHPHLRALAQHLHDQQIGAMRFTRGVDRDELLDFLTTVVGDGGRTDAPPLGLAGDDVLRKWTHVALFPIAFDQLQLLDSPSDLPSEYEDDRTREARTRAASLWIGLAQAALAGQRDATLETDPSVVADAIDSHEADSAYDQAIVGYLLQIAKELSHNDGAPSASLQQRISRLLFTLKESSLKRLLDMGGDVEQRKRFVLDASHSFAAGAVLEVLKAAADVSKFHVSTPLVSMLTKLAANADEPTSPFRAAANVELRSQVQRLLAGWTLGDPNPDHYNITLQNIAGARSKGPRLQAADECDSDRLVDIALEVGATNSSILFAAMELVDRDGLKKTIGHIDAAAPGPARDAILDTLLTPDQLRLALVDGKADGALIDRVVAKAGTAGIDLLLDLLEPKDPTAPDLTGSALEMSLIASALARVGPPAVPRIAARLNGMRPISLKLLLGVLEKIGHWPPELDLLPFAHHPEVSVRRETIKLLLLCDRTRETGITIGVGDADEHCVHQALRAAALSCPPPALRLLMHRTDDAQLGSELRVRAIRVIASFGDDDTMTWLAERLVKPHWLFRTPRLREKTPQLIAALSGLAARARANPRVGAVLLLASASRDPEIRAAVNRKVAA
jgi:hypothetical protein